MEQVYFSALRLTFIPAAWKDDGTYTADAWPKDAALLTDEEVLTYWKQTPSEGKQLGSIEGRPTWVDLPLPTKEELIAQADSKKSNLLPIATAKISILQDAVDLEMATDQEAASLTAWKKYRVLLNRVDTSTAPDITWPETPE